MKIDEIKFRGWIKEDKKTGLKSQMIQVSGFDFGDPYGDVEYEEDGEFYCIHDRHVELMQYTGLKDKNGKEIYEGDIIEFGIKIVFKDGAFRSDVDNTPLQEWIWKRERRGEHTEVVGNIYQLRFEGIK